MAIILRPKGGGGGGVGGGVSSLSESGQSALTGAVTLSEGTGITLTQVGNDIEISSTAQAPTEPVSGMEAWYDANDIATFTIVSNRVSVWEDKSANNFDLSQGTAGDRPTYNAAPRTINGIICPEFTTGGEFLESACPADDRTSTTFVVGLCDSVAAARCMFGDTQGGGNEVRLALGTGATQTLKSGVSVLATQLVLVAGLTFIYCQRLSAPTIESVYISTRFPTAEATTFTAGRTLRIGMDTSGTVFWDGLIGEFIRYSSTLSNADVVSNSLYLLNKWGI